MRSTEYTCDVCGERKTPQNGWTMASISKSGMVLFWKWNPKRPGVKTKHLCSPECETKFLLQNTSSWRAETNPKVIINLIRHKGPAPYVPTKVDPLAKVVMEDLVSEIV